MGELMMDPVQTADGQVYERVAIGEWFRRGNRTSPLTGLTLPNRKFTPFRQLKSAIDDYIEAYPSLMRRELDRLSLKTAAEMLEEDLRLVHEGLPTLSISQRRAWMKLVTTAIQKGDTYVLEGLWDAGALSATDLFRSKVVLRCPKLLQMGMQIW